MREATIEKGWEFIQAHFARFGCAPTVREITAAVGARSSRTGKLVVDELVRRGRLHRDLQGSIRVRSAYD